MTPPVAQKVGGSLFRLEDLPDRLSGWLDQHPHSPSLILTGGGNVADEVRRMDQRFGLGLQGAHLLSIRAMSFHAHLLASLLPEAVIATNLSECNRAWDAGSARVILDPFETMNANPCELEAGWHVTSDSIAAFLARLVGATRLVLLKSVGGDHPITITEAIERGWLDHHFPKVVGPLNVEWVNLRKNLSTELRVES